MKNASDRKFKLSNVFCRRESVREDGSASIENERVSKSRSSEQDEIDNYEEYVSVVETSSEKDTSLVADDDKREYEI